MSRVRRDRDDRSPLRRLLNPFDLFVLGGATVNLIVVAWVFGYWLLRG
jgi:hypothetical protein